jgi:hypothetical protein
MHNEKKNANPNAILYGYYAFAVVLLAVYVYVYQFAPLPGDWNDVVVNFITPLASFCTAFIATAVLRNYHPEDRPRAVWMCLAVGSWLWFLGDAIYSVYVFLYGDVPNPSIADISWVIGMLLFIAAFYYQYAIIMPAQKTSIQYVVYGATLLTFIAPALVLQLLGIFTFGDYINYYYPPTELLIGIAGLALLRIFQGGALTRPWIGLVAFSVADLLYAWADQTGAYSFSVESGNPLSLIIDATYIAAYLIMAWGFLSHWVLLNYGARGRRK